MLCMLLMAATLKSIVHERHEKHERINDSVLLSRPRGRGSGRGRFPCHWWTPCVTSVIKRARCQDTIENTIGLCDRFDQRDLIGMPVDWFERHIGWSGRIAC